MRRLRAVSLFSNCGAGDLGYRKAGFRFDVMAELKPERLEVCLLNHPEAEGVVGDLRLTWRSVIKKYRAIAGNVRPALLCACPPCQGLSSARSGRGNHEDARAGSKDKRNLLVTVVAKVAKELKPSVLVVENVQAFYTRKVLHPDDKKAISAANLLIESLVSEYMVFPLAADMCEFGIPQSRKRAFLTFVRRDLPALKGFSERMLAPFPKVTHGVSNELDAPVSITEALQMYCLPSLDAASTSTASVKRFRGFHSVPVWKSNVYRMVAAIPPNSGRSAWENCTCSTCGPVEASLTRANCPKCSAPLLRPVIKAGNGRYRLIRGFESSYRRMHATRPAATITTASGHIGSDYTIHPRENRLLSPLECALLQTFPRGFRWGDALDRLGHTKIREMIGEAVPPAFTKKHGDVIRALLWRSATRSAIPVEDNHCSSAWKKLTSAVPRGRRQNLSTTRGARWKGIRAGVR